MVLNPVRTSSATLAMALAASVSAFAGQGPCHAGPGAAFGITGYNCARCGLDTTGGRPAFAFHVEPVVLSVDARTGLRPGDVVASIDGLPITSRKGADRFTYPEPGAATITVRRDGSLVEVRVETRPCPPSDTPARPAADDRPAPMGPGPRDQADATGRFGFAVACLPSCTRVRGTDGADYWKFDGEPPVADVRPGGPADAAGLQRGDRIIEVNGIRVLTEEGARALARSQNETRLQIVARRDNESLAFDLRIAFAPSSYQRPGEQIETAREVQLAILEKVVGFYRPPRSQARWLDRELLPASPGSAAASLDAETLAELLRRVGTGAFCASDARQACRAARGGRLTLSPVYRIDDTHARVVVAFESAWPNAPSIRTTQTFLLRRDAGGWRIERREGGKG